MPRSYYNAKIAEFLNQSDSYILGELARNNQFDLNDLQRNTWLEEIAILKECLQDVEGHIIFEYTIPRIGSRVDVVLIIQGVVYILEFKCGDYEYSNFAIEQALDYALDLKNFHKASHNIKLVPILIATNAKTYNNVIEAYEDNIVKPLLFNKDTLINELRNLTSRFNEEYIDPQIWLDSAYQPTPTIIEAAQALYAGHNVEEISRSDAGAQNLAITAAEINNIIENSKKNKQKSICFITGVPGAGKTLAGLNIACDRHKFEEEEHAVFLSGNGPLVDVLQEALARDDVLKTGKRKSDALRKAKSFIQIIHHFRDDALRTKKAPLEKVVIFDEAQRAWDLHQTSKFMQTKKGVSGFQMSEPEFLISIMDRHEDWATIICLIGGGQEINVGEAGLLDWFEALKNKYCNWDIYLSNNITDTEYVRDSNLDEMLSGLNYQFVDGLHLAVSLRSFRSEKVAEFVKAVLDIEPEKAREVYKELSKTYPIKLTRDLNEAKELIKQKARGSERYGITASSGGRRLRTEGVWVQSKINAVNWFLNGKDDVRSSYYLEETATEFDIQGLELDFTIVAWDANLRYENGEWGYYNFSGTEWKNVNNELNKMYLKNAYRVLMTRARQGFVIYLPEGSDTDFTRKRQYYDNTYNYLAYIMGSRDSLPIKNKKPSLIVKNISKSVSKKNDTNSVTIKVGKIAQTILKNLLSSENFDKEMLNLLLNEAYSKQTFNLNYPLLVCGVPGIDFDRVRYYKEPLIINGEIYYLCSQWFGHQKQNLLNWIEKIKYRNI
ncbi:MAG: DUF2075 domain-containing protein [Clostridiales bacterium]|nr:DUF2075 domain-containing protein [Clostridiales bacterium]